MNKYVSLGILLREETFQQIKELIEVSNIKNKTLHKKKRYYTVEDFVVGCVYYYLDNIEKEYFTAGYDDLGKPFRLKNRIKEIIDKKGITQARLSEMTGIDPSNISQIVRNKNQPSLDYFLRIWIALGTPPINKILYREK